MKIEGVVTAMISECPFKCSLPHIIAHTDPYNQNEGQPTLYTASKFEPDTTENQIKISLVLCSISTPKQYDNLSHLL